MRFFAGVPVIGSDGQRIGTLCVMDQTSRALREAGWLQLNALANFVAALCSAGLLKAAAVSGEAGDLMRALRESEQRYQQLCQSMQCGYALFDVVPDLLGGAADFVFREVNPVFSAMMGVSANRCIGQRLATAFDSSAADANLWMQVATRAMAAGESVQRQQYYALQQRWLEIVAYPLAASQCAVLIQDITEQKRLVDEVAYRDMHDPLTGLLNRPEFERCLQDAIVTAQTRQAEHTLLHVDLDDFRLVNDECGRAAGDDLLKRVAELLQQCIRSSDTLSRLSGDEFAILLMHCTVEQAQRVAQTICDRMDMYRFVHDGCRFRVGASIGLVPVTVATQSSGSVLQAADTACRAAKDAGRNRVQTLVDIDHALTALRGQTRWVPKLEQALDGDRFLLYSQRIQPLQDETGGIHCEILLRMKGDDGKLIPPGMFLPAAERFHMASRIDRWVVRNTLLWLEQNVSRLERIETVAVNLSGQSLGDRTFHGYALNLLDSGAVDCRRLCFEVTETAAISNLRVAAEFFEALRERGARVALDDFGSGVSSFAYLKTLPVDYIKIDGQFVRGIVENPIDRATVRCINEFARALGKSTIAEFVEREDVEALLREHGVNYSQGFLRHRPIPIDDLLAQPVETRNCA
jgi:diguanylate cyclase (GGDEF)-like protein